ncbi:hypothetical protein C7974DRAFT_44533 [Boeremia exigua]|uniref:uncharacterized protein n=1 Tax=Boeremia exigua TaxID=749465 RepID=UPI001E8EED4A|nr:uncharacterized protein C7974DRAFT_44533 [Boeremia exigua]KAH6616432.1 hypothetical protein C7974DRAFT_44533 [Boeremia exigua]
MIPLPGPSTYILSPHVCTSLSFSSTRDWLSTLCKTLTAILRERPVYPLHDASLCLLTLACYLCATAARANKAHLVVPAYGPSRTYIANTTISRINYRPKCLHCGCARRCLLLPERDAAFGFVAASNRVCAPTSSARQNLERVTTPRIFDCSKTQSRHLRPLAASSSHETQWQQSRARTRKSNLDLHSPPAP